MANLKTYQEMLSQPWGKILYELIFAQLTDIKNQDVLDFGAGFGITAQQLSQKNRVTAVEPNADMLWADDKQTFQKIHGSLEALGKMDSELFDTIICHNVLEYVPERDRQSYFRAFERLLKPGGKLSLIKHNQVGKVMQAVVFDNKVNLALDLLDGKAKIAHSFGHAHTYTLDDLAEMTSLHIENYRGLRTFYALQPNTFKTEENWIDNLLKAELAVADLQPYKDIAFLQHVTLRKTLKTD
ncbi:class I SAM-dependent methyltransferase [Streptococcus plurextorum]|uniref:class I SAM-dependent methyltransferase n=1 Tax=Streptococcus plurextorum TaxID=456876 RepID=UPI0003FD3551|nr:class I SAM-dependent methyltransferase [Streptococcus plurextorum]